MRHHVYPLLRRCIRFPGVPRLGRLVIVLHTMLVSLRPVSPGVFSPFLPLGYSLLFGFPVSLQSDEETAHLGKLSLLTLFPTVNSICYKVVEDDSEQVQNR